MLPSSILHTPQLDCTNVCFHQIPQTISFSIPGLGMEAADTRVGLIIEIYGRINILSCSHTAQAAVMMPGAHVSAVWAHVNMLPYYHVTMLHAPCYDVSPHLYNCGHLFDSCNCCGQ